MNASAIVIALGIGVVFLGIIFRIGGLDKAIRGSEDTMMTDTPDGNPVPDNFALRYSFGSGLDYTLTVDRAGKAGYNVEMCHAATSLPVHSTILLSQQEVEETTTIMTIELSL